MSLPRNIGYSAWGFLGNGIIDTPDGGRSHRLVLLEEMMRRGVHIHMLQKNRDLQEANESFEKPNLTFDSGFPEIDALFLEYRWKIPGRNCGIATTHPAYTPDLDRQDALLDHYLKHKIPILVWDKDQRLEPSDQRLISTQVSIFVPSLQPPPGRSSLLFPINHQLLCEARKNLAHYEPSTRHTQLIYIGNQYDRDKSFAEFYDRASQLLRKPAQIYGKWSCSSNEADESFKHVNFHGRIGFEKVAQLYEDAFATVLIAPERYYTSGQYTQRLFEASWGMCIPLVPSTYSCKDKLFPAELVVDSAESVYEHINILRRSPKNHLRCLLNELYDSLAIFLPSRQVDKIELAIDQAQRRKVHS